MASVGNVGRTPAKRPKLGFEPPDRNQQPRVDAVGLADALDQGAVAAVHLARGADGARREPAAEVGVEAERELCLCTVAFENLGNRLDARQRPVDDVGTDAPAFCFHAQLR